MKKSKGLIIVLATLLIGCQKSTKTDPYSYEQSTIYSESNNTNFSSILLNLKPYILDNGIKKYIVSTRITNVILKIDEDDFGSNNSLALDTSIITKQSINNYLVTTEDITYGVNIPFKTNNAPLTKAGEYSDLLNNIVILSPGFYHCRIESFEIKLANNVSKKVTTNVTQYFEIKSGMKNIFLGEFPVLVK